MPQDPPSTPSDSLRIEFLGVYLADSERGERHALVHYLALFPGHEHLIAREYLALDSQPAQPEPERVGEPDEHRVGPYRLLRELGRGGQGAVWLAEDTRLGRRVALKLVPRSPLWPELAPRFQREAQAASRLEHPGLCAVHDVGADERVAWIAMRYVEGETLAARIARERAAQASGASAPRDLLEVARLVEQAARALHEAHEAGVVHRDVKPANLMVTPGGEPVVLDFGIAREDGEGAPLTLTGDALGTPAYMAPEQLEGARGRVDRRVDVWSLGVTLYEALTLRRPFEGHTREALVRAVLASEPANPRTHEPALPRDLAVIALTALSKERDRRYQSALELAEDLRRVREHEPIRARPAGPLLKTSRWTRRNPALAASLAALVLALVLGLAVTGRLLTRTRATLREKVALLDEVTRLSDQKLARDLVREAQTLWPALPDKQSALGEWLARAGDVGGRADLHRAALAAVESRLQASPAQAAPAEPTSTRTQDEWLREQLQELLNELEALAGAGPSVEGRLAFAREVERRTLEQPRTAWDAARGALAADPRFAGVGLVPQLGLVPLGADPTSGLQEFAHLASGQPPSRDPATGELVLEEGSALVLVLLPGGEAELGCELSSAARPAGSPNVDRWAGRWDGPVQRVQLDPFFIAKHEMTQGQWLRHEGRNPSTYTANSEMIRAALSLLLPVESVSWNDCARVLRELDLSLPTEAQWEHAARGGTGTPWWTGEEPESLAGAANLSDTWARAHGGHENWRLESWLDDGHTAQAPAGSFRPNAFGLHELTGNVKEWCRDTWEDLGAVERRPGDGLLVGEESARVFRGGSFSTAAVAARSAARDGYPPDARSFDSGLRPARELRR